MQRHQLPEGHDGNGDLGDIVDHDGNADHVGKLDFDKVVVK